MDHEIPSTSPICTESLYRCSEATIASEGGSGNVARHKSRIGHQPMVGCWSALVTWGVPLRPGTHMERIIGRNSRPNAPKRPQTGAADASTPNSPTQTAETRQDPRVGCWRPPVTSASGRVSQRTPHRGGVGLHIAERASRRQPEVDGLHPHPVVGHPEWGRCPPVGRCMALRAPHCQSSGGGCCRDVHWR